MTKVIVTKDKLIDAMSDGVRLDKLNKLIESIAELVTKKNHDYGDAWQRYGVFTPLIRMNDKMLRIATLVSGGQALIADESVKDNLVDIIGYSALALLWLEENAGEKSYAEVLKSLIEDGSNTNDGFPL